jgi:hypothetical protein
LPTIDINSWASLDSKHWAYTDVHLLLRCGVRKEHNGSRDECVRCKRDVAKNKTWGQKMELIPLEAETANESEKMDVDNADVVIQDEKTDVQMEEAEMNVQTE